MTTTQRIAGSLPAPYAEQRPWGGFERLVLNETCTVKVIVVEPGRRLSLQRHAHRDELWQVLDPGLVATVGDRSWHTVPGERVWVPRGSVHRLGCEGDTPARVLEVAFGDFDENDIERLEDDFARES